MTDIKTRIAEARAIAAEDPHSDYRMAPLLSALATDCENLLREWSDACAELGALQTILDTARLEGESDADTLRRVMASHAALKDAGEEMPQHGEVMAKMLRGILDSGAWQGAQNILNLFRPLFARLTQERDEAQLGARRWADDVRNLHEVNAALRQRAERAEAERDDFQDQRDAARIENVALRARLAELESRRVEPSADVLQVVRDTIAHNAFEPMMPISVRRVDSAARAVLSALTEMGEEAWPSHTTILEQAWPMVDRGAVTLECAALDVVRSRLAPVIGALRSRVADLEARVAKSDRALADAGELYAVTDHDRRQALARETMLEAEAAHDQDPDESAPQALRRVREERDDLRAKVEAHVEGQRRDERRIAELETALAVIMRAGQMAAKEGGRVDLEWLAQRCDAALYSQAHVSHSTPSRSVGELDARISTALLLLSDDAVPPLDRIRDAMVALGASLQDPRVDWTVGVRPAVLGGECSRCFHRDPLHEPGCRALPCVKPEPCACRACHRATLPQDAPAASAPPESQAEAGEGRTAASRATVDLSSWPALREVEARASTLACPCAAHGFKVCVYPVSGHGAEQIGVAPIGAGSLHVSARTQVGSAGAFVGDDPEGVAEAFAPKAEAVCSCPPQPPGRVLFSAWDPACPCHGVSSEWGGKS
jgi:hypothetical protein